MTKKPKKIPETPKINNLYLICGWIISKGKFHLGVYGMSDTDEKDAWGNYDDYWHGEQLPSFGNGLPLAPFALVLPIKTSDIIDPKLLYGLTFPTQVTKVEMDKVKNQYHDITARLQKLSQPVSLNKLVDSSLKLQKNMATKTTPAKPAKKTPAKPTKPVTKPTVKKSPAPKTTKKTGK